MSQSSSSNKPEKRFNFPSPWRSRDDQDYVTIEDANGRDLIRIPYNRWQNRKETLSRDEAMTLADWIVRMPALVRAVTGLVRVMRDMV